MIVAVMILLFLVFLLFLLGCKLAAFAMHIQRQSLEDARAWQEAHYDLSWYDPLEKNDYVVDCKDGYRLHVEFLKNPVSTTRYILLSHGYTDNRFGSLKYAKMYLDLGFHVIAYDLRGHGANDPTFCTYSARESQDLSDLILDSRRRYPEATFFGIHGESLGAASSIAVLRFHPQIDFVVADCPFSEITSVIQAGMKSMHIPPVLAHLVSLCARIRYGYSFHTMRPIDSLPGNTVPILFIHGAADTFIPPHHSQDMAKVTSGYSEVHLIPQAPHAASILTAPQAYKTYVQDFLQTVEDREKRSQPCI